MKTIENHLNEGGSETICILPRTKYNSQLFDMINFVLLYLIPLCVMTVLYTLIAVRLWNSSLGYPPLQVNSKVIFFKFSYNFFLFSFFRDVKRENQALLPVGKEQTSPSVSNSKKDEVTRRKTKVEFP